MICFRCGSAQRPVGPPMTVDGLGVGMLALRMRRMWLWLERGLRQESTAELVSLVETAGAGQIAIFKTA